MLAFIVILLTIVALCSPFILLYFLGLCHSYLEAVALVVVILLYHLRFGTEAKLIPASDEHNS